MLAALNSVRFPEGAFNVAPSSEIAPPMTFSPVPVCVASCDPAKEIGCGVAVTNPKALTGAEVRPASWRGWLTSA